MNKRKYVRRKKIRGSWANLPDFSDYRDPVLPDCSNGFWQWADTRQVCYA